VNALGNDASIDTLGSTHSLEEFKRGQKSFFEAAMKKQSMMLDHVNFTSTPEQNRRGDTTNQKKLLNDLERSGARFKCTNCKQRKVEVELPCTKCQSLNCNAD